MKQPKSLTKDQVRELYLRFLSGEPKLHIARGLEIDNSTVHYHINKISSKSQDYIISLITPRDFCHDHTSVKCGVCGRYYDNIKSDEYKEIIRLRKRVRELETKLNPNEDAIVAEPCSPPVITIVG